MYTGRNGRDGEGKCEANTEWQGAVGGGNVGRGHYTPAAGRGARGRGCAGHGGRGRGNAMGVQCFSEDELQTLSQGSPEDVQASVTENEVKFLCTYKHRYYCNNPKHLKRLIKLLYLLVRCENQSTALTMLAQILSPDGEYAFFTNKIDQTLRKMLLEDRDYIKKENLRCIEHLIEVGSVAIKTIPSTVLVTYPVTQIGSTIAELRDTGERVDLVSTKFEEMNSAYKVARLNARERSKPKVTKEDLEGDPPEPFSELSILPTPEEIRVDSKAVFLRRNKILGGYNSCDHYFDVQFRLLREDFIRPLREGINTFSATKMASKASDIRVYEGAKILNPVCLFTGIGFQLRFNASRFTRVNWEHSRRLIFGSLLCLSNDNFDQCLLFATVVKRDPKDLEDGLLTIKFENNVDGFQIDPGESYMMIESTAYYEAYRHILKSMQDISESPDTVPLEKYIVKCDFTESKIPVFLNIASRPPRFNMADILMPKDLKQHPQLQRKVFDVTNQSVWPLADRTHLDESQLRALQMALSKEVSVIQGPPGTGKTYIGLKIVEAYLKNRVVWDPQRAAPILVVCYTNHALDQFLEGIHKLEVEGNRPNIIRVGGRCKSESLESCILSKKVQECRSDRSIPRGLFSNFMDARKELSEHQRIIDKRMENCDAESKQKIIKLNVLQSVVAPHHCDQLFLMTESAVHREMEVWLELWYPEEDSLLPSLVQNSRRVTSPSSRGGFFQ